MPIEPVSRLLDERIAFFRENGFLSVEAITTQEEIAFMRELYDRIFELRAGREAGDQFDLAGADEEGKPAALPQILGPSKYAPEFKTLLCRTNALALSRQLLGEAAEFQGEHAILKPARVGAATPWHQDEAYWNPSLEYHALSVWIPLQEATVENGCMHFVPGSHRLEVLPHHSINRDTRVHGLEVEGADTSQAVACPLPPGGATFHLSRTLHYAGPNNTANPRRAFILGFGLPPTPYSGERRFPWNEIKQTAREERAATRPE
ncbi:MAG: phytanoyl-CoA dioxygenase family protein [FCB group bacterium]|nr:phytanoyl-CoA dioxygenase family protein [FCB group bacterium]